MLRSKLSPRNITEAARAHSFAPAALAAIREVESGGYGFDPKTGRILIQFEPRHFAQRFNNIWIPNGVENQAQEWIAFNKAWYLPGVDKNTRRNAQTVAMLATSWGAFQIMGFHYSRLGFKSVGEMVDYMKQGEVEQLDCLLRFINSDTAFRFLPKWGGDNKIYTLPTAIRELNWRAISFRYNGANYATFSYHLRLASAYKRNLSLYPA